VNKIIWELLWFGALGVSIDSGALPQFIIRVRLKKS
jgi:hypothetical protein